MAQEVVLIVGRDATLVSTRSLVLASVGFTAISANSVIEALSRISARKFDLVLLDSSLAAEEQNQLIYCVRAAGLHTPVALISPDCPGIEYPVDWVMDNGPVDLILDVKGLVDKYQTSRQPGLGMLTNGLNSADITDRTPFALSTDNVARRGTKK